MPEMDKATTVAIKLSDKLAKVSRMMRNKNSLGFGNQRLSTSEYRAKWFKMPKGSRDADINKSGLDTVLGRMGKVKR